jgi:hypothetical protein
MLHSRPRCMLGDGPGAQRICKRRLRACYWKRPGTKVRDGQGVGISVTVAVVAQQSRILEHGGRWCPVVRIELKRHSGSRAVRPTAVARRRDGKNPSNSCRQSRPATRTCTAVSISIGAASCHRRRPSKESKNPAAASVSVGRVAASSDSCATSSACATRICGPGSARSWSTKARPGSTTAAKVAMIAVFGGVPFRQCSTPSPVLRPLRTGPM